MKPTIALATTMLLLMGSIARAAEFQSVTCEGYYTHHLQGVCTGDSSIFWCFTTKLVKTDQTGKVLKQVDVADHHGDLCFNLGKVYVAVNLGTFNDPKGNADSWVYEYDAADLSLLEKHKVPEALYGAGGIACSDGRFIVVGGLPPGFEENFAYEYDQNFKFVKKHVLKSGYTLMGLQTATFAAGHWWFGCYGKPRCMLKADKPFQTIERFEFDCSLGIVPLGDGKFLVGRDKSSQKGHRGSLLPAEMNEQRGLTLTQQ